MASRTDTIIGALVAGVVVAVCGIVGWAAVTVVDTVRRNEGRVGALETELARLDTVVGHHDRWLLEIDPGRNAGDSRRGTVRHR